MGVQTNKLLLYVCRCLLYLLFVVGVCICDCDCLHRVFKYY